MLFRIFVVAACLVACSAGGGEETDDNSGSRLLKDGICWEMVISEGGPQASYDDFFNGGYFLGSVQAAAAFCRVLPNRVTKTQAGKIVLKYLREHPERLHLDDKKLILEALDEAFRHEAKASPPTSD